MKSYPFSHVLAEKMALKKGKGKLVGTLGSILTKLETQPGDPSKKDERQTRKSDASKVDLAKEKTTKNKALEEETVVS